MKHKLELRLPEISITSDMQMTPHLWQKAKKNYDEPWQYIKNQRHYFADKVHLVKAMVFQ